MRNLKPGLSNPRYSSLQPSRRRVARRAKHGQQVLDRRVALDIVNRVEDEAAARAEDLDALAHFAVDLLGRGAGG